MKLSKYKYPLGYLTQQELSQTNFDTPYIMWNTNRKPIKSVPSVRSECSALMEYNDIIYYLTEDDECYTVKTSVVIFTLLRLKKLFTSILNNTQDAFLTSLFTFEILSKNDKPHLVQFKLNNAKIMFGYVSIPDELQMINKFINTYLKRYLIPINQKENNEPSR